MHIDAPTMNLNIILNQKASVSHNARDFAPYSSSHTAIIVTADVFCAVAVYESTTSPFIKTRPEIVLCLLQQGESMHWFRLAWANL